MTKISITPIISYIIKFVRCLPLDERQVRDGSTKVKSKSFDLLRI